MTPEESAHLLLEAQGNPKKLALATVELLLSERPAIWRTALNASAIPHWFDMEIISHLLDTDGTFPGKAEVEAALSKLPIVEPFRIRNANNVHETTRLALRERLVVEQPALFRSLSQRAAAYFAKDARVSHRIEAVYHRLLAAGEEGAAELGSLVREWSHDGRIEALQALAVAIDELKDFPSLQPAARAMVFGSLAIIRWNYQPLEKTERLVNEALRLYHDLPDKRREAVAIGQLGNIAYQRNQPISALDKYEAALSLMKELAATDQTNVEWQRDLSVFYERLGNVYLLQQRLDDALREYRASARYSQTIAVQNAESNFQRDLAISHSKIAEVLYTQARWDDALHELRSALDIARRLSLQYADNPDFQHDVAIYLSGIGDVLLHQDRLQEALDECQRSVSIAQEIADKDPAKFDWQRSLSFFRLTLGDVLARMSNTKDALQEYRAARDIRKSLVERDPENMGWQHELSVSRLKVGDFLSEQGLVADAVDEYEAALAIFQLLKSEETEKLRQKVADLRAAS